MKTLEQIEADLRRKRAELTEVKGTETEIYSRIVGYYRSLKNWNAGKKEEFAQRVVFSQPDVDEAEVSIMGDETRSEKRSSFITEKATFKGVADFKELKL